MLQYIGAGKTGEKIEAFYCLNKQSDTTIVKFLRRRDYDHDMRKKMNKDN